MTGALTNNKKLILKMTLIAWLIMWKYSPSFVFNSATNFGFGSTAHFFLIRQHLGPLLQYQFLFWKGIPIFLFNLAKFGTILHFLGPLGLFFGLFSGSKTFLRPFYVDNQLWFWKYSHIFLVVICPYLGPLLLFFGSFGAFFWQFGAIFVVGVRFKNISGTYLSTQTTLVLEIQP